MLRDPNAAEDALLVIDQPRFEDIWSGDLVLIKRNYEISDEAQPFSFGLVAALLFRERRMVRDVAIAAVILGLRTGADHVLALVVGQGDLLQGVQHVLCALRRDAGSYSLRGGVLVLETVPCPSLDD